MRNIRSAALAGLFALLSATACTPDDYPSAPRFDVEPDLGPVGHMFVYNVLAGVPVTSVNLAGTLVEPNWSTTATPMPHTYLVTVDMPTGTHEYKFVFNGDQWAGNMCNDATWGDPANGGKVDPAVEECNGENAVIEVDEAGPVTFRYVIPAGAPAITSVNLAGSFQGWDSGATPMRETYSLWLDLEPGSYEYKFVFNGDQWAGDMCNDPTWGDPANGNRVDANGTGCNGQNASLTID